MSNDDDDDIGPLVLEEESVSGEAGSVSEGAGSVFEEAESATDARWQLTAEFSNKNDLKDYIQLYTSYILLFLFVHFFIRFLFVSF